MATDLFTSGHPKEKFENLSKEIKYVISELQKAFPEQSIEALSWNSNFIAIPLDVEVNIPSRGTIDGIDIREKEPIFLLFNRQNYPYEAPSVCYNRKDFPATQLPHLNPTFFGMPASFCLHRGSIDNWFAENTIENLVYRTSSWLSDAAKGRLIRKEDGFEPTRIDFGFIYSIFDSQFISNFVEEKWKQSQGKSGFVFLWYKLFETQNKIMTTGLNYYAIRLIRPLENANLIKMIEISSRINYSSDEQEKLDRRLFGILTWPSRKNVCNKFFAQLPNDAIDLRKLAQELNVPLTEAFKEYLSSNLNLLGGIPVSIVIPRTQKLIGKQSYLEPISFIVTPDIKSYSGDGIWSRNTKVEAIKQRDPLTLKTAREISSRQDWLHRRNLLIIGCGALGSKLICHLARSGQNNMTLVDHDVMSPHNLVRHALINRCLGLNKAEALKNAIIEMFEEDKAVNINVITESALNIFLGKKKNILDQHSWIIDTTASPIMLNILREASLPKTISCCRCEIADEGSLGLLIIEGQKRNPRLDDLQVEIFNMAIENKELSQWLQSNRKRSEEELGSILSEIRIGISCSSETMKLSDDIVSLHAAYFSIGFKKFADQKNAKIGRIQISQYNEEVFETKLGYSLSVVRTFEVPPVTIIQSRNDPRWQVRMKNGVEEGLHAAFLQAMPNETGGLLIGRINQKAKIIYVTDFLKAPSDSTSTPFAFKRGVDDVPLQIDKIDELTGGLLGYVGEWHTHPNGDAQLSSIDGCTAKAIKKYLDCKPLPTHIMVVTKKGLHPYIFDLK